MWELAVGVAQAIVAIVGLSDARTVRLFSPGLTLITAPMSVAVNSTIGARLQHSVQRPPSDLVRRWLPLSYSIAGRTQP